MSIYLSPAEDQQLIENGYSPLPVDGKAAVAPGWQSGEMTPARMRSLRQEHPAARNTGLRTGTLAAIDIDIPNPEVAEAVKALAIEVLGPTPLIRVGSKGFMLCYRNAEPIRKVTVLTDAAVKGEFADKVEVLGTGLQFVAFGVHPQTKEPFRWIGKDDFDDEATPLTIALPALPSVSGGSISDFCERCASLLGSLGYPNPRVRKADEQTKVEREANVAEDAPANIARATTHLKNCVERGDVAVIGALGNDTIYELACALIDRFYLSEDKTAELMLEHWYPHCTPNTLDDDLRSIVSHAASYIQNEPGARALPPVAEAFRDALDKHTSDEPQADSDTADGAAKHIVLLDENSDEDDAPHRADKYLDLEFPPLRELIPVWCERNINTFLEGPAATQKSRAALQDAIALSAGLPVLGKDGTEPVECLYMNYENSPEEMSRRIHSICRVLQLSNKDEPVSPKGVQIWELRKNPRPILVVKREGVLITRFGQRFLSTIATRRNAGKHTLVIFDGLMDAIIFLDNTRNDDAMAMALIRLIDSWCAEYDFTAYSIVHPSRSSERGGSVGSYATAWTTKPRAIQTFKRVLSPYANAGPKAKITEDTPLDDIFYQRRVQKRSNGPEGERILLEYWKGGLRPHFPKAKVKPAPAVTQEPAEFTEDDEIEVPF